MGAPKGNKNAKKAKDWENALRLVLAQYTDPNVRPGDALRKIAEKCVMQALEGDDRARYEIGNRLDGKVRENIHMEAEFTHQLAVELTEAQLEHIAAGGSAGAAETPPSPQDDPSVH